MGKKIIGLTGSLRADSWNLKLLRNIVRVANESGHYEAKEAAALNLPLFNEELEKKPLDAAVTSFRESLKNADVVVISSPEYNGSFSGALKNAIDWASRPPENLWAGKTVVLAAGSPGAFAGIRGLIQLRTVLSGLKSWVIPDQVLVPFIDKAFDEHGKLVNENVEKQIQAALVGLESFHKN